MKWEPHGWSHWEIDSIEELNLILGMFDGEFVSYDGLDIDYSINTDLTNAWVWDDNNFGYFLINKKIRNYLKAQRLRMLK